MAIKCSNCGGELKYNIRNRSVECDSCGYKNKVVNIQAQVSNQINEEYDNCMETNLYQCDECGAEIRALNEEATVFCPYCGKQSFLIGKEKSKKPDEIIPFWVDKEQLKREYEKKIKQMKYVPKDMRSGEHMEKCTGIYIPYWSMSVGVEKPITFDGTKTYSRGNYSYYEEYEVESVVDGSIDDITFDASESFDDTISTAISPFLTKNIKPFNEGYLAGFYADKETVDSEVYKESAEDIAMVEIKKATKYGGKVINLTKPQKKVDFIHNKPKLVLFPVWFITHRNKDRVSYIVVNGQTGKMSMDIPIDKKAFWGSTFILGIILSILFAFLFSTLLAAMTPTMVSYLTILILSLSSAVLYSSTSKIYKKDIGLMDIGRRDKKTIKSFKVRTVNEKSPIELLIFIHALFIFLGVAMCFLISLHSMSGATRATMSTVLTTIPFIVFQFIFNYRIQHMQFDKKVNAILPLLFTIVCTIVYCFGIVNNTVYYALSCMNIIGVICNAIQCINGFNYLTSRPVPNFFRREEVQR